MNRADENSLVSMAWSELDPVQQNTVEGGDLAKEALEEDDEAFLKDETDPGYQDLNRLELILNGQDHGTFVEQYEMKSIGDEKGKLKTLNTEWLGGLGV